MIGKNREIMENWGVKQGLNGIEIFNENCLPKVKFLKRKKCFQLTFLAPGGFGIQQFNFELFDFASAFYDAQFNHNKPRCEQGSVAEFFFGKNYKEKPFTFLVGTILECFNITPSMLKRLRKTATLLPKKKKVEKFLSEMS